MRPPAGLFRVGLTLAVLSFALLSCDGIFAPEKPQQVDAPTFGFPAGPTPSFTLTTSTPGATIRYTIDGASPSASVGTVYAGPVSLWATTTVRAIAVKDGWKNSPVVAQTFTVTPPPANKVATPVAFPGGGIYSSPQTVSLTTATENSQIFYTTDNSLPSSTNGTPYVTPIALSSDTILRAIAIKSGWSDSTDSWDNYLITPTLNAPTISPNGGTFSSPQTVTLSSDADEPYSIYYTVDGTKPDIGNRIFYSGSITVSETQTIRAIVMKTGWNDSPDSTANFVITSPTVATPAISPNGGTFTSAQLVTITSGTQGATIYYTTNGAEPTAVSTPYTGTFTVSATSTVKALAVKSGMADSSVASASFTINVPQTVATPAISPNGGTFTSAQMVTITSGTQGATIHYTTNGSTPTTSSPLYNGSGFTLSSSATVKAIAVKDGWTSSELASASFTINVPQTVATPAISPNGGTFTSAQLVTITSGTQGATIHYTTNGSTPTTSSPLYNGSGFTLSSSATVRAIAVKDGWTSSELASASFTINTSGTGGIAVTVQ